MKKLLYSFLYLSLILLSSLSCAMGPGTGEAQPLAAPAPAVAPEAPAAQAIPPVLIELRGRLHQGWQHTFRLSRNLHATYNGRLSQFTRPIAKILGWTGALFGGYKSYKWYTRGNPTIVHGAIALAGGIACFIGSHLARLFIHPGLPVLSTYMHNRNEIRELRTYQERINHDAEQLFEAHQMRRNQFLALHLAEKDSALAEEAEDYRRTTLWRSGAADPNGGIKELFRANFWAGATARVAEGQEEERQQEEARRAAH